MPRHTPLPAGFARSTTSLPIHGVTCHVAALSRAAVSVGESLDFFPERYPRVKQRPELRRYIVAKRFKVFYRVNSDNQVVEILRCWDGRRGTDPKLAS